MILYILLFMIITLAVGAYYFRNDVIKWFKNHWKKFITLAIGGVVISGGGLLIDDDDGTVGADTPSISVIWPDNGDTFSIDGGDKIPIAVVAEDPNGEDLSVGVRIDSGSWVWNNGIKSGEVVVVNYDISVSDDTSYTLDVYVNDDGDTSADVSDTGNTIYSYDESSYRTWSSWDYYATGDYTVNPSYGIDGDIDTYTRTESFAALDGWQYELAYYGVSNNDIDVVNTRWAMWDPEGNGNIDDIDYYLRDGTTNINSMTDMTESDIPPGQDGDYWDWTTETGGKDFFTIDRVVLECDYKDAAIPLDETSPSIYEMQYMEANEVGTPQLIYPPNGGDVSPLTVGLSVSVSDFDGLGNNVDGERIAWDIYGEKGDSTPDNVIASGTNQQLKTIVYKNWDNLDEDSTYYWKVKVTDEFGNEKTSSIFSFDTKSSPSLSNPDPADDETGVDLSPWLVIDVSNDVGDRNNLQFKDASDDSIITESLDVQSMGITTQWTDVDSPGTEYQWYVYAWDADGSTTSPIYTFTTEGNDPPIASNPDPSDGSISCSTSVTYDIDISDDESDSIDVKFYKSDDTLISTHTSQTSGSTVTSSSVSYSAGDSADWYVELKDSNHDYTKYPSSGYYELDINSEPTAPTDNSPSNGTEFDSNSVTLSVRPQDPDGSLDSLDVSFYGSTSSGTPSLLSTDNNVVPGSTASYEWSGLSNEESYIWYTITSDDCSDEYDQSDYSIQYNFDTNVTVAPPPNNPPIVTSFELIDEGNTGWDLDNNNFTASWSVYDSDDDQIDLYFNFGIGSEPSDPTNTSYHAKVINTNDEENNIDIPITNNEANWADTSSTVYVKCIAFDGTNYSNDVVSSTTESQYDEGFEGPFNSQTSTFSVARYGQTFSPTIDMELKSMEVYVKVESGENPGNIPLKLYEWDSGISGSMLSSGTVTSSEIGTSYEWYEVDMSDYNLSESTNYFWYFDSPNSDEMYFRYNSTGTSYPDGSRQRSLGGGSWSSMAGDIGFILNGTAVVDSYNSNGNYISFCYHMYGSSMGTLSLLAQEYDESWTTLWSESGNQGDTWYFANVSLENYTSSTQTLRFDGYTGSSYRSDMALDTITIGNSETVIDIETFESGTGDWDILVTGDDMNWTRDSSGTGSGGTGPSSGANSSTWYIYTESSSPNYNYHTYADITVDFSDTYIDEIDEGFENGFPPNGWKNYNEDGTGDGWQDSKYGSSHSGSHFAYSWVEGDVLTTPQYGFGINDTLSFWYASEGPIYAMDLEVWVDYGTDDEYLLWSEYSITDTTYDQVTLYLDNHSGEIHDITFKQLQSQYEGLLLDDIILEPTFNPANVVDTFDGIDGTSPSFGSFTEDGDTTSTGNYDPNTGYYDDSSYQGDFSSCSDSASGISEYYIKADGGSYGSSDSDGSNVGCTISLGDNDIMYKLVDTAGNYVEGDTTENVYYGTTAPDGGTYDVIGDITGWQDGHYTYCPNPNDQTTSGVIYVNSGGSSNWGISADASSIDWGSGGFWSVLITGGWGGIPTTDTTPPFTTTDDHYSSTGSSVSQIYIDFINNCGLKERFALSTTLDTTAQELQNDVLKRDSLTGESYSGTMYDDDTMVYYTWDEATDGESGIYKYYAEVGDSTPDVEADSTTHDVGIGLVNQENSYYARIVDNVGNYGNTVSGVFIPDTISPYVDVWEIENSSTGPSEIQGNSSDNYGFNIKNVSIYNLTSGKSYNGNSWVDSDTDFEVSYVSGTDDDFVWEIDSSDMPSSWITGNEYRVVANFYDFVNNDGYDEESFTITAGGNMTSDMPYEIYCNNVTLVATNETQIDNMTLYWRESEDNSTSWSSWTEWNDASNPDETWPFEWDFTFPDGEGYYEFYVISTYNGNSDNAPDSAQVIHKNTFSTPSIDSVNEPSGPMNPPIIIQDQTWAILNVTVNSNCQYDTLDVEFINKDDYSTIDTVNDVSPGGYAQTNWSGLDYNYTYNWYVNVTSDSTEVTQMDNTTFILNDIPELTNFRIEDIESDNIYLEWNNPEDILWFQITISNEDSWVSKMTNDSGNIDIDTLLPSTVYDAEWSAGDDLNGIADVREFNFSTYGWNTNYYNWNYKRLINISPDSISSDLENYAITFSLTEDNFNVQDNWWDPITPSFTKMLSNGDDIRFTDYYDTSDLSYEIESWSVPGNGGISEDETADEAGYSGTFINPSYAWDNDWNTKTSADTEGILYINYTVPGDILTGDYKNEFHIYAGTDIYLGLLNEYISGSELRLKADMNYSQSYIDIKLYNWTSSSYENFDYYDFDSGEYETSNISSRYFYDTSVTWAYDCEVEISVKPLHFNDDTQSLGEGIDANYTTKMWMYYGNSDASNQETVLSPSGYDTSSVTIGDEIDKFLPNPEISNLETEVWNDGGSYKVNVTWNNSINCNNYLYYSENPWNADANLWYYSEDKNEVFEDQIGNKIHVNRLYAHGDELESYSVDCSNSSYDVENTYWEVDDSPNGDNAYFNVSNCGTSELLTWWVNYTYNKSEQRSSSSPSYVISGLDSHKTYYIQAKAESVLNTSRYDTEDSSFVIDGLNPAPVVEISSYTEDRPDEQVTLSYTITDMNSQANVDISVQYINNDDDILYETTPVTRSSTGTYTETINVEYDNEYEYRIKIEGSNTNYSDIYTNWFMPIGPFFAGNYIEDDDNNNNLSNVRDRQYLPPLENTSMDLDGSGDYYNCGDVPNLHNNLTISFWAKPEGDRLTRQNPIGKAYGGEFAITFEDEPSPNSVSYFWGSTGLNSGTGGTTYESRGWNALLLDEWAHYCFVRNNSAQTVKLYVNGELQSGWGDGWITPVDSSLDLYVGNGYTNEFEGCLDDVMLFNDALTQSEINLVYSGCTSLSSLIHYWSLDDASSNAIDSVGSSNGTVYGNPQDTYNPYLPEVNLDEYGYEQYGYWEGSEQEEDWMWVETNISNNLPLTIHLYKKDGTHVNDYTMNNDADSVMQYYNITGLGQDWYTFYITDSTNDIVLNWTKPGPYHKMGDSRIDESKYVKFGGTKTTDDMDYRLMYLDWFYYDTSAYRYVINEGYDLYEAMSVTYWGQEESGIPNEDQGTPYDRGQMFRGGVTNGENQDSGMINDNRIIYPLESFNGLYDNPGMDDNPQRHCFSFTAYWFNESALFDDEIENWYFRFWEQDSWYSTYLGRGQTALWGGAHLFTWQPDAAGDTRDWSMYDGSQIEEYDGIPTDDYTLDSTYLSKQTTSNTTFNSTYDQHLMVGYRDLSNTLKLYKDQAYNFGVAFDGRWPNQQLGEYQQAYVAFNLPDNATLETMDSDSDGLNDYDELFAYYTNPKCNDTDEDGYEDGDEVNYSTDPNLYTSYNLPPIINLVSPSNDTIIYDLDSIYLTWTSSDSTIDDGLTYDVYFEKGDDNPEYVGDSSDLFYEVTNLDYSSTYYWKVIASDGDKTNTSSIWCFTTRDKQTPNPPSLFNVISKNISRLTLRWSNGLYSDYTYIEYSESSSPWSKGSGTEIYNGTGIEYDHSDLDDDTTYYYQAWSWNDVDKVWSNTYSTTSDTTELDESPIIYSISPSNHTTIYEDSFTWSGDVYDKYSDIDWSIECNGNSDSGTASSGGTISLNVPIEPGNEYIIYVNLTDGNSWTRVYYVVNSRDFYTPSISSFSTNALSKDEISISFLVDDNTDYTILEWNSISDWDKGDGSQLLNTTSNSVYYTHTNLNQNTQYHYKLFAYNITDGVYYNETQSETTLSNVAPYVYGITPYNNSYVYEDSINWRITIQDDDDPDNIDWSIECKEDSNSSTNDDVGTKSLTIGDLGQGQEYTVYVNISDDYNSLNYWYKFTRYTEDIPYPPETLSVDSYNFTCINISWGMGSKADQTRVEYDTTADWDRGEGTFILEGTQTSTSICELQEGTTYYIQLWSYNNSGFYSDSYASISQRTKGDNVQNIYNPIPNDDDDNVDIDLSQVSINLYDSEGTEFDWWIQGDFITNTQGTIYDDDYYTKTASVTSQLDGGTEYSWTVKTHDVKDKWSNKTYTFITEYPGYVSISDTSNPSNGSVNQNTSLTFGVYMSSDESFEWWLECSNGDTTHQSSDTSGTKSLSISGLDYSTEYTVWANATVNGNYTRKWYTFTTKGEPSPDFSISDNPIYDDVVYFTDESTGYVYNYWWNFGNGKTSTNTNPTTTYNNIGNYTVTLNINDNTSSQSYYVDVGSLVNTRSDVDYFVWLGDNTTLNDIKSDLSASSIERYWYYDESWNSTDGTVNTYNILKSDESISGVWVGPNEEIDYSASYAYWIVGYAEYAAWLNETSTTLKTITEDNLDLTPPSHCAVWRNYGWYPWFASTTPDSMNINVYRYDVLFIQNGGPSTYLNT